jgi:hypothetical protein
MRILFNIHVTRAAVTFSLSVAAIAAVNLLGGHSQVDYAFLYEVMGLIAALEGIDCLVAKLQFKTRFAYTACEFVIMYAAYLVCAYLGHWCGFRFDNFIICTLIFLVIFVLIRWSYHMALKKDADVINRRLTEKKKEGINFGTYIR